jgi:hypothetical protein
MPAIRPALLLAFLLTSIAAFAVQPPPPRAIGNADVIPAAYRQDSPDVAWTGAHFLAVWSDQRKMSNWRYATANSVFAARVDEEGRVLDRFGIEITDFGFLPRVASNGTNSLIAYSDGSSGFVVPIAADGRRGATVALGEGQVLDIASNGSTYCVVTNAFPSGSRALILDQNGAVLRTAPVEGLATTVVAVGGSYFAFSGRGLDVLGTVITRTSAKPSRVISSSRISEMVPVAIAGGDRILVAWHSVTQEITAHEYFIVDEDLELVAPHVAFSSGQAYGQTGFDDMPSLAWDGRIFVMSWEVGDAVQEAVRIDDDGRLLDTEAQVLTAPIARFASAYSGGVTLLVSEEGAGYSTDMFVRAIQSLHTVPRIGNGTLLALSATPQMDPDVAWSATANTALAVSIEGDGPDSIVATLFDPRRLAARQRRTVSSDLAFVQKEGPSAAAAGNTFLVAWREMANFRTRIAARYVAADGTFLGEQVPIADEEGFVYFGETAVASNGDVFLIVWDSANGEIRGRRVRANGEFLDPEPFLISRHPASEERERATPAVAWTGSEFLVAWSEHEAYFTAPPAGRTTIRGARVRADGTVIDSGESKVFFSRPGHGRGVDLAVGDSRIMLVASFSSFIQLDLMHVDALALDLAGNPTAAQPTRLDVGAVRAQLGGPTVAAVGDTFYALWGEETAGRSRVRATQLSANAQILDRFDNGNATAYAPAATTAGGEILIVQSQHDTRQAGVVRLFATSFAPGERATPRVRSVRH